MRAAVVTSALLALSSVGCGRDTPSGSGEDTARRELTPPPEASQPDTPHPSDGQGRVRLSPDEPVVCGSWGSWNIDWIAGSDGLPAGAGIVLQVSPFWGWSPPQTGWPGSPGYTTASGPAGVSLRVAEGEVPMTIVVHVEDGALAEGDTLRFVYGDSARGGAGSLCRADMYAERFEEFLIKTDGNGDGFFAEVGGTPTLRILPGPAARLAVAAPALVEPEAPFGVLAHALDARDNLAEMPPGEVSLSARPLRDDERTDAADVLLGAGAPEVGAVRWTVSLPPGLYRLVATARDAQLTGANDLLLVEADSPFAGIRWGDIHCHSALSDGTGAPEDLYTYARDVVGLDVCAVTDHDAHGTRPLAGRPWDTVREATERFHEPGRFVTLLGYEWTSWTWGHRNVYYPGDEGGVFDFLAPDSDTPGELWERIAPQGGVTIPHHPGGGPVPVDWSVPSAEERETVVEICSIHGSSEAPDVPRAIYRPVPGHFVRDALGPDHRLGILASGDTHDGHPGRRSRGAATNGLAAFRTEALTREGVMGAIAGRAVYGTSGPRVLLATDWGGHAPGTTLDRPAGSVVVRIVAPEPIESVQLIGPGGVAATEWGGGRRATHELDPSGLPPEAGWAYVRVALADGEVAWESPWWIGARR